MTINSKKPTQPRQIRRAISFVGAVALIGSVVSFAGIASAQEYPNKPVKLVVPFPPAGSGDVLARVLSDRLGPVWNQPIVVDNKPGAGANIGSDIVAKATPDGYTLLIVPNNVQTMNPFMGAKMPFDPAKDFEPVTLLGTAPFVLAVGPSLKVNSVKEMIAAAKSRPGGITYASSGTGSVQHLMAEMFRSMTGTPMTHVPYKGGAPAVIDLVAGVVDVQFGAATALLPQIRAGKLTPLAVTGASRNRDLPNVPTMIEAGIPGYVSEPWIGVLAPAKTPPAIIAKLNKDIRAAMADPALIDKLSGQGIDVATTTPAEFNRRIETERAAWGKIIADAGIKGE